MNSYASLAGFTDRSPGTGLRAVPHPRTRIVETPARALLEHKIVIDGAAPALIDAVKTLRTRVLQRMRENGWRTLAVVSPGPAEGRTLVAANLAVSIAAQFEQTALLVDADLLNPSIDRVFGVPSSPGLADILAHGVPVHATLSNPGIDRMVVMPAGGPVLRSAEWLGSIRMAGLLAELRNRYDDRIVIIDLPPLLGAADALAFLPLADAVLMVVEDNRSVRDDILVAQGMLDRCNLIGMVLNKSFEGTGRMRTRRI